MAFLASEDDKQNDTPLSGGQQATPASQAPNLSGGSSFNGSASTNAGGMGGAMTPNMGGGTSAPQQAASAQNAGRSGRFVNLQDVMGQNTGLGAKIQGAADTNIATAKAGADSALDPLRKATFQGDRGSNMLLDQASAIVAPDEAGGWFGEGTHQNPDGTTAQGGTYFAGTDNSAARATRDAAMARMKAVLNQKYTGPGATDFSLDGNANLQNVAELGNAATAGKQLAQGPYQAASGIGRLDRALLGTSPEAQAAMAASTAGSKALRDSVGAETTALNSKVNGFSQEAADNASNYARMLTNQGSDLASRLQTKADAVNTRDNANQANGAGTWTGPAAGSATAGDFATTGDTSTFGALRDALGADAPNIAAASGRTPGGSGSYTNTPTFDDTSGSVTYAPPTNTGSPQTTRDDGGQVLGGLLFGLPAAIAGAVAGNHANDPDTSTDLSSFSDDQKSTYQRIYQDMLKQYPPDIAKSKAYTAVMQGAK